jgi:Zn-dependent protease
MHFSLVQAIVWLLVLLISIDVHEFSHALVATRLGDPTPRYQGRLTLNPKAHLDPTGTLMMVFAAFAGFGIGWGKPVQVNPYRMRGNPRLDMGLVALAGPTANVVLAILSGMPLRFGLVPNQAVANFLLIMVWANIGLAVFNLIPLFPLDGYSVFMAILEYVHARDLLDFWARLSQWGPGLLLLLLMADWFLPVPVLSMLMWPPMKLLSSIILGWT